MTSGKIGHWSTIAAVLMITTVAGCSSGGEPGVAGSTATSTGETTLPPDTGQLSDSVPEQPPSSTEQQTYLPTAPPPADTTVVTGEITWPDGQPARNVLIEVYPQGVGNGGIGNETPDEGQADAQGRYAYDGCPCQFSMWFLQSATPGRGPFDGGRDCWIPMAHDNAIDLVPANPGDAIDWTIVDVPCSDTPYNPRDFDTAAQSLVEQQNALLAGQNMNFSGYAGPWQNARQRAGD